MTFIFKYFLILFFTIYNIFPHNPIKNKPLWNGYYRLGVVNNKSSFGFSNYGRLKRTTDNTYNDLRFFGNIFEKDKNLILRQKSSRMILSLKNLYSFNTLKLEQNTLNNVNIRYQSNQGIGFIKKNYKKIDLNIELGIAFDNSDYLNTKQKTSYIKIGNTIDKNINPITFKFEIDYFKQINKNLLEKDLSRIDLLSEFKIPIKNNIYLIIGILNQSSSKYIFSFENNLFFMTFSNSKNLNWEI